MSRRKEIVPKVILQYDKSNNMFEVTGYDYFSFLRRARSTDGIYRAVMKLVHDILPENTHFYYFKVVNVDELIEEVRQILVDEDQAYVNERVEGGYVRCCMYGIILNPSNRTTYVPRYKN